MAFPGTEEAPQPGWFATTHWTVVLRVAENDSARRNEALERLCRTYWEPVYAFIRHGGHGVHDAQDLTQGFFAHLLAHDSLKHLDPHRGKFRSFLLVVLRHFLINEAKHAATAKRGGGQLLVPLEIEMAEGRLPSGLSTEENPEHLFDRHWALTVLDRALSALRGEFEEEGALGRFEQLKSFLSNEGYGEDYVRVAAQLSTTPGAIKVAVHRLRHRYGELLRREVAHTVESPLETDDELRYLLELVME